MWWRYDEIIHLVSDNTVAVSKGHLKEVNNLIQHTNIQIFFSCQCKRVVLFLHSHSRWCKFLESNSTMMTHLHHQVRACWTWVRSAPCQHSGERSLFLLRGRRWRTVGASHKTVGRTAAWCHLLSVWRKKTQRIMNNNVSSCITQSYQ